MALETVIETETGTEIGTEVEIEICEDASIVLLLFG
jgi:hypothetical protein